jgi:hypothetical protein
MEPMGSIPDTLVAEAPGPTRGSSFRPALPIVAIAIASVWLVASLAVGFVVITGGQAGDPVTASPPQLSSLTQQQFYGGDAYTGIQNAAADTQNAVVSGVNQLGEFQPELARSQAASAEAGARSIRLGLGFLVIGVGVAVFTSALQAYARSRR